MQSIEQRLASLELSAARWRKACLAAVLSLVVLVSLGAAEARRLMEFDVVSCHALFIVNDKNEPVAVLNNEKGNTVLTLGKKDAQKRITLCVSDDGARSGFSITRDTGDVLGVVTDRYKPVQNAEAFSFCDGLLADGIIKYESAGAMRGGKNYLVAGADAGPNRRSG